MLTKYNSADVTLSKEAAEQLIGYFYIQIEELQLKYFSEDIAKIIDDTEQKEDAFIPWDDDMSN